MTYFQLWNGLEKKFKKFVSKSDYCYIFLFIVLFQKHKGACVYYFALLIPVKVNSKNFCATFVTVFEIKKYIPWSFKNSKTLKNDNIILLAFVLTEILFSFCVVSYFSKLRVSSFLSGICILLIFRKGLPKLNELL